MENNISLSYIMVTKNKLPYLRAGLEKLSAQKKPGEEIIIADGASTDGTRDYLESMKQAGKIDRYISEKDYCESHALNKLFLLVRGTLVKIINDDDVYYYPNIEKCKKFMLEHPEVDILGTDGGSYKHSSPSRLYICHLMNCTETYNKWQKDHTPFCFSVLGIMFRRSSLPLLGFWNLTFRSADTEYTYRVTAGKANVAWYTGSCYVYIKNEDSVVWEHRAKIVKEIERLEKFYLNKNPESRFVSGLKEFAKQIRHLAFLRKPEAAKPFPTPWPELKREAEDWLLQENNGDDKAEFLWNRKI